MKKTIKQRAMKVVSVSIFIVALFLSIEGNFNLMGTSVTAQSTGTQTGTGTEISNDLEICMINCFKYKTCMVDGKLRTITTTGTKGSCTPMQDKYCPTNAIFLCSAVEPTCP